MACATSVTRGVHLFDRAGFSVDSKHGFHAFRARVLADDLRWLGKLPRANQFIMPRATLSYGGLKMSGTGKENTLESMLDHFTSSKTVIINPGNPRT